MIALVLTMLCTSGTITAEPITVTCDNGQVVTAERLTLLPDLVFLGDFE